MEGRERVEQLTTVVDALFARLSFKNYQFLLSGTSGAFPALLNSLIASVVAATVITGVALSILFVARRTTI